MSKTNKASKIVIMILVLCLVFSGVPAIFAANFAADDLSIKVFSSDLGLKDMFESLSESSLDIEEDQTLNFDTNMIITQENFSNIKNNKDKIQKLLGKGKLFALYNYDGTGLQVDDEIEYPITIEAEKDENFKTVARIFFVGEDNKFNIQDVSVAKNYSMEKSLKEVKRVIKEIVKPRLKKDKNKMVEALNSSITASAATTWVPLGSYGDSKAGSPYGFMQIAYDVQTLQDSNGKDYYSIHSYITGTPGEALTTQGYESQWVSEKIFTQMYLSLPQTNSMIFKYGPYNAINTSSYSVNVAVDSAPGFSWTGNNTDVDVTANVLNSWQVNWEAAFDSLGSARHSTFTFEPGITAWIPSTSSSALFTLANVYTVDSWTTSPVTAVDLTCKLTCYPNRISGIRW